MSQFPCRHFIDQSLDAESSEPVPWAPDVESAEAVAASEASKSGAVSSAGYEGKLRLDGKAGERLRLPPWLKKEIPMGANYRYLTLSICATIVVWYEEEMVSFSFPIDMAAFKRKWLIGGGRWFGMNVNVWIFRLVLCSKFLSQSTQKGVA